LGEININRRNRFAVGESKTLFSQGSRHNAATLGCRS
jgi:hypothetical protein